MTEASKATTASRADDREVFGQVTYGDSGRPARGMRVTAMDADLLFDDTLGETTTDEDGRYRITYGTLHFRDLFERAPDIYLTVRSEDEDILASTHGSVIRNAGTSQEVHVQLPGAGPVETGPTINVGGLAVDRKAFQRLEPEMALRLGEVALRGLETDPQVDAILQELSPQLSPARMRAEFSMTPLVLFLEDAAITKKWPREFSLRVEELILGYDSGASYSTYDTTNFSIGYETTGSDQPPAGDAGGNITMPGTGAVVGTTVAGDGIPDYIEKLGFWLENALATYTNPPFSLANPAAGGRVPVSVTGGGANGTASRLTMSMTITTGCNDDLLAAIPTHELMHLIQYQYEGAGHTGSWHQSMLEGGAVLGEDVVFDTHNRYIVQASQASGLLTSPSTSLNSLSYRFAPFLKYISEQQSSSVNAADEPAIGVETYRALMERFDTDGHTDAAFEATVGQLPWYQSLYRFGYLDAANLDETSSETLLGDFWLACYLKDFGTGTPDRRFDFMEDEESATWDTIFQGADTIGTLGSVALTTTTALNAGGSITLSAGAGGSVSPFAARYYKVDVAGAVDTLRVDFTAGAGFTRPLVQIVLVEPGNVVRDILRSDRMTWSRSVANARSATDLDHILIVVAGTDVGGTFTLAVQEVAPAPDVMVSRWHHVAGQHYEIDSFGWAWTWVSPDIWVDNDGDGLADSEVYFDQNNQLFIRLRNHGNADAAGIGVQFWYQDASPGLSDAAWLPVQNAAGATQSLTGLNLAAGVTDQWSVDWAPAPSGTSQHFCVRAVVTVPGDPNTDNKRCVSNFGNVVTATPYVDLPMLRRISAGVDDVRIDVIPRTRGKWLVSAADMSRAAQLDVKTEQEHMDVFRLRRHAQFAQHAGTVKPDPKFMAGKPCWEPEKTTRRETRPDPFGHYPTDPRALPPGVGEADLVTIAHVVDGRALGGFTWAIREK